MPITKDEFDEIDESAAIENRANRILDFLVRNDDRAYTTTELAEETGVPEERVGPALARLRERGAAERRSDYWRVTDHALAVRTATAMTAETARQHDNGESFDLDTWAEYAVDEAELNRGENE